MVFRARKLTMLEQALSDAGINIYVGLGADLINAVIEDGNWGVIEPLMKRMFVKFNDYNSVAKTGSFTVWCFVEDSKSDFEYSYRIAEIDRIDTNKKADNKDKWLIGIWDFKEDERIPKTVYSRYDLAGRRLSGV